MSNLVAKFNDKQKILNCKQEDWGSNNVRLLKEYSEESVGTKWYIVELYCEDCKKESRYRFSIQPVIEKIEKEDTWTLS